jgi:hypothetical protein
MIPRSSSSRTSRSAVPVERRARFAYFDVVRFPSSSSSSRLLTCRCRSFTGLGLNRCIVVRRLFTKKLEFPSCCRWGEGVLEVVRGHPDASTGFLGGRFPLQVRRRWPRRAPLAKKARLFWLYLRGFRDLGPREHHGVLGGTISEPPWESSQPARNPLPARECRFEPSLRHQELDPGSARRLSGRLRRETAPAFFRVGWDRASPRGETAAGFSCHEGPSGRAGASGRRLRRESNVEPLRSDRVER